MPASCFQFILSHHVVNEAGHTLTDLGALCLVFHTWLDFPFAVEIRLVKDLVQGAVAVSVFLCCSGYIAKKTKTEDLCT